MNLALLQLEAELAARFGKFQPARVDGFHLPGLTRTYLEYDDTGAYRDIDPATGDVVDVGVLPQVEREAA